MSGAINVGVDQRQRDLCLELKIRINASSSGMREEESFGALSFK